MRIIALLNVDEEKLRDALDPGVGSCSIASLFEEEMGWVKQSGIDVINYSTNQETYLDAAVHGEIVDALIRANRLDEFSNDQINELKDNIINDNNIWQQFFEKIDEIITEM